MAPYIGTLLSLTALYTLCMVAYYFITVVFTILGVLGGLLLYQGLRQGDKLKLIASIVLFTVAIFGIRSMRAVEAVANQPALAIELSQYNEPNPTVDLQKVLADANKFLIAVQEERAHKMTADLLKAMQDGKLLNVIKDKDQILTVTEKAIINRQDFNQVSLVLINNKVMHLNQQVEDVLKENNLTFKSFADKFKLLHTQYGDFQVNAALLKDNVQAEIHALCKTVHLRQYCETILEGKVNRELERARITYLTQSLDIKKDATHVSLCVLNAGNSLAKDVKVELNVTLGRTKIKDQFHLVDGKFIYLKPGEKTCVDMNWIRKFKSNEDKENAYNAFVSGELILNFKTLYTDELTRKIYATETLSTSAKNMDNLIKGTVE